MLKPFIAHSFGPRSETNPLSAHHRFLRRRLPLALALSAEHGARGRRVRTPSPARRRLASNMVAAGLEAIPANLPKGEARSPPPPPPTRALDPTARKRRRNLSFLPLSSPLSSAVVVLRASNHRADAPRFFSQDGYVEWDKVDVAKIALPPGDDMGVVRCAERRPRAIPRDLLPAIDRPARALLVFFRRRRPRASAIGSASRRGSIARVPDARPTDDAARPTRRDRRRSPRPIAAAPSRAPPPFARPALEPSIDLL